LKLVNVENREIIDELLTLENKTIISKYKFGVLYLKHGQTTEEQSNKERKKRKKEKKKKEKRTEKKNSKKTK